MKIDSFSKSRCDVLTGPGHGTSFATIFVFITDNQSSSLSLNAHVTENLFFYLSLRAHFSGGRVGCFLPVRGLPRCDV